MQAKSQNQSSIQTGLVESKLISFLIASLSLLSSSSLKSENIQKLKVVAITQIVAHRSLDEAKEGILKQLKSEGFESGKNLKIVEENAQGNIATANLIAKKFVGMKPDLIIPISTPSALAAKNAAKGSSIPIVFSSISDPVGAALIGDLNKADLQITGASDAPDLLKTQALMRVLLPKAKRLGVLYNAGEYNSVKALELLRTSLDPHFLLVERSVPNSNLVVDAVQGLVNKVDVLYIPSDNTVFSALPKVIRLANAHKIPTFTNVPDSVTLGIFASYGYSQEEVGKAAGHLAAQILRGEKPGLVVSPANAEIVVNAKTAKILSVNIPKNFQDQKITLLD